MPGDGPRLWRDVCLPYGFFFNDTATTEIYTLSLHDALPISHGRLVAGDDQQHDHAGELLFAQRVAPFLDLEQSTDQIVARGHAPTLEELAQVGDELVDNLDELRSILRCARRRDDLIRPAPKVVAVADRDAQQLGDHRDWKRKGELVDKLHLASRLDRINQLVRDLLDPRAQLLDHPWRERLGHEPAQPAVIIPVLVQHVSVDEGKRFRHPARVSLQLVRRERECQIADEALVIEENGNGVVMARDEPEHGLPVNPGLAQDWILRTHPLKRCVGLRAETVAIEVVLVRCSQGSNPRANGGVEVGQTGERWRSIRPSNSG